MTDTKKLREKIDESGLKLNFIAEKLNISRYCLQKKIENDNEFKASEVEKIRQILELSAHERDLIFFA